MPPTFWKSPSHLALEILAAVLVESLFDTDCRGRDGRRR
jgi:hypothetical protein